ncbi:transglutaminase-like domain-containing protein, partial [Candidatus Woesearchaeota archaeon]|nr:transglutaminase-like domain-containing protein [Candidatus Woesearchaeota archaeon]
MIVKNDTSAIQNAISIKHFTKEGMNGVCHPKDLILLEPMAQKKRMIEAILRNYIPNRTFTSSTFAPDMRECIIGKFKIRDQDYLVIDSHLFFNEYFETFARDSAGTKHAINYNNFLGGYRPVDFWREFVNLRGKSEKEIEAFNKNASRTFVSKKVKFAGMDYTFVAHNPKDLEEADKISENLAKSKAGEIKIEQFADLISSGSSDAVDKIVQGKETLSDVVETLNGFFKGKMANDSVDDWHVEAEKLVGYRKHDCDTSSKIVVNALRKKGFPANMLVVEGPMKDNKTQIGHAWAEVYIPSKDVILTIDFSDPSRNYIFKADSRQKMKYMFDKYGSKTRPFQMTFSQAFDL